MKLRIVDRDGSRSRFSKLIFMRYLPLLIIAAIPYLGPVLLLAVILSTLFNKGVALHDQLSNTRVIDFRQESN